jgi:tetratricopeptide (TPR) repeat protein
VSDTTRTLAVGERIGEYQILGIVGAGGMGVVYRALDVKLERTVALKFLTGELSAGEKEKAQFLQEAKAASSLDHTNVGVIHGVEETEDGRLFIVMAFYEGETLSQRIRREPLPVNQAVNITIQMAQGLAEAHAHHVVHRDIKPSNVILTSQGVAKIVDFGLARVVSSATLTQSGGITGTIAYMSPEQAVGKRVDQRTDIWSLGVVLAEMLTGQNPFQRDTLPSIMLAIMGQPPALMDGVPPELQPIIYRALSKDPESRYQSCAELLADLQQIRMESGAPAGVDDSAPTRSVRPEEFRKYVERASGSVWPLAEPRKQGRLGWIVASVVLATALVGLLIPSVRGRIANGLLAHDEDHIAVLPFDNIGNDPANEAVAEGLMDSLTSKLSNLEVGKQSLWVVPASEVRRLKIEDPTAALHELGATLVVKGSVGRDDRGVHLTVNLINAKTLRQVGSAAVEDASGDFAAVQDEAVSRLARLMGIKVTADMLHATGGSVTPAAYESYLKALGYMQRYDKPGNLDLAIGELQNAVKTDARFALGFAGLGEAYSLKYLVDPNPKWIDEAAANCKHAAELDDHLPSVYVTLGRIHSGTGQFDLAVQEFQRALDLNPRDADALVGMASTYEKAGRIPDAETTFKKAVALRPDNWDGYNALGLFYDRQRRYSEAVTQIQKAIELTPDNAQAYSNLAAVYLDTEDDKQFPDAENALKKSISLSPSYWAYANLGVLYYGERRYAEAAGMAEKALQLNGDDYRVWENLGAAYEWLGQQDKAAAAYDRELEILEKETKLQSQDSQAQSALGNLYARKHLRDKAMPRIRAALALAPTDSHVLVNVAEAYEMLGDRRQALSYIEQALKNGYSLDDLKQDMEAEGLLSDPDFKPHP